MCVCSGRTTTTTNHNYLCNPQTHAKMQALSPYGLWSPKIEGFLRVAHGTTTPTPGSVFCPGTLNSALCGSKFPSLLSSCGSPWGFLSVLEYTPKKINMTPYKRTLWTSFFRGFLFSFWGSLHGSNQPPQLNKHQAFWAVRSWPSTESWQQKTCWANCLLTKYTEYIDLNHPSAVFLSINRVWKNITSF